MMKHSTGNRTKAEQARFDKMKEMGICMACYQHSKNTRWAFIEIHHLLSGNKRIGHMATVSLCGWHHRGVCHASKSICTELLGPSLAHGSKPFRAEFGTDKELLELQNIMLGARSENE
jgi:hypothetical protein